MKSSNISPIAYGLKVTESCYGCVYREDGLFCRLPQQVLGELNQLRQNAVHPKGTVLFVQGGSPRGVFILCSGQAKLSVTSRDGKNLLLRRVNGGEVLGLSSVIANTPYPATAETLEPSQVSFIPRPEFLRFLRSHGEVAGRVAEHLSAELHKAWNQATVLALAPSTAAKLAELLTNWANDYGKVTSLGVQFPLRVTQEEIAETIGASRETVSRLLAEFKHRGYIRIRGNSVVILNPNDLQALAAA